LKLLSGLIDDAGPMLDRLTHRIHILEANGESYRLADAKRRLKRK
jgi:DNA replication protein DnaC